MKPRVLILGREGMLGHMVLKAFENDSVFKVAGTQMQDQKDALYFQVGDIEGLSRLIDSQQGFDFLINCIGITANKMRPDFPPSIEQAIQINSVFPLQLARLAANKGAKVIHISTDGVFSGTAHTYDETVLPDCRDAYGMTKVLGEANSPVVLNIRCSIIGPSPYVRGGLWEWFASQADDAAVTGYTNHIWTGVTTLQFAGLCRAIIKDHLFDRLRSESGVYHFAPNTEISKYELLNIFKKCFGKTTGITAAEHPAGAVRRILKTKYENFRKIAGDRLSVENAIQEIIFFIKKGTCNAEKETCHHPGDTAGRDPGRSGSQHHSCAKGT